MPSNTSRTTSSASRTTSHASSGSNHASRWRSGALLALVVLAAAACSQLATPAETVPPPSQVAVDAAPGQSVLERGELLFGATCAGCHGQHGQGSQRGPSLIGVGAASADFQLSTGRMPLAVEKSQPRHGPPAFPVRDIDALVVYVASLGDGPTIPVVDPGDLQEGRELFLTNCAACHGSTAVGAALPAGHVAPSLWDTAPTQIAEAARVGPGLMPRFPSTVLSQDELNSIVTYVRAIPEHDGRGGWPIGSIGPLTEGLVAWLIGMVALVGVVRLLGKRARR